MSQFAGTQQLVMVPKDLKECLKILPKELVIEIFAYVDMKIILMLTEQFHPVILRCLKIERHRQNKPFASFFMDLSKASLIRLILSTDEINKKMLMQAYVGHKRKLIESENKAKLKSQMQKELFKTIHVGDIIMTIHQDCYLITKKFPGSFKGRYVNITTSSIEEHGCPTLIIPRGGIEYKIFKHQLFIQELERFSVISDGKCKILEIIKTHDTLFVENRLAAEVLGMIPKEDLVRDIAAYYTDRGLNYQN
jgi:ribosomal protein S19E (S16A)